MEVHVPKAARSFREFAIELLTIVTGIVIAISLEQAVEAIHWHQKAKSAREVLRMGRDAHSSGKSRQIVEQ